MELNREQIIKALECCTRSGKHCTECVYFYRAVDDICAPYMIEDALSLIKELTEEVENYRNELGEVRFALAEANNDKKELTDENERLSVCNKILTANNADLEAELSLTYDLLEETKADTVRKYREQLHRAFAHSDSKDKFNKGVFLTKADQIAEEMLGGNNVNKED